MRRSLIWIGIAALWIAFVGLVWLLSQHGDARIVDFRTYYDAAWRLRDGEALYTGVNGVFYVYPPLLAQIFMPLVGAFSLEALWNGWIVVNIGLLIGTVALLSRRIKSPVMLWLIVPLFMPIVEAFYVGQVTIILLALLAGAWMAAEDDSPVLAGALLALAAWIKVFPALLIVYFIWKRDWRVVRGALVAGIGLAVVQVLISGIEPMISMMSTLFSLNQSGQAWTVVRNASVFGFTAQLFEAHAQVTPLLVSPALFWISRAVMTLGLLGGCFYLVRRSDDFDAQFSLVLLTSMLISPTLFPASMPPLLLVFFLLLRRRRSARFVLMACVVLSLYWLYAGGYQGEPPMSGLVLSFGFYALIATWGVHALLLHQQVQVRTEKVFSVEIKG